MRGGTKVEWGLQRGELRAAKTSLAHAGALIPLVSQRLWVKPQSIKIGAHVSLRLRLWRQASIAIASPSREPFGCRLAV